MNWSPGAARSAFRAGCGGCCAGPMRPEDTPERAHERRQPQDDGVSVLENADRAAAGPLTQLYIEGRTKRPR